MASDDSLIEQAIRHYQLGNLDRAVECCRNLIEVDPDSYEALHLLGIILNDTGLNRRAVDVFRKALSLGGSRLPILHDYGLALMNLGKFGKAAGVFGQIVEEVPTHIDSWHGLGQTELLREKFVDAITAFEKVLTQDPDRIEARISLSIALRKISRLKEAREHLQKIIDANPKNVAAQNNIGIVETELGNLSAAKVAFLTAIGVNSNYADAHYNLGNVYWNEMNFEVAAECYLKSLELGANYKFANYNLALCQQKLRNFGEALNLVNFLISDCTAGSPELSRLLSGRANIYRDIGKFEEALNDIEEALALSPQDTELLGNKALTLLHAGDIDGSIAVYRAALWLDPDNDDIRSNFSQALLLGGFFIEGWSEFEVRLNSPALVEKQETMPGAIWRGEDLAGRHILIWCEQGLGDTIQFLRFVLLLSLKARRISLVCPDRLKALLNNFNGRINVIGNNEVMPDADYNVPLMSLPHLLGIGEINNFDPYINADNNLIAQWGKYLGKRNKPRIGVNWQGNPSYGADHQRSIPLSYLRPLILNRKYEFVCLQQGFGLEQLVDFGGSLVELDRDLDKVAAFVDTAAIIANLDLVITSDTALAHLAGALGMPVWLLLPATPDWRWLLNRDYSPWYLNMRLFRQPVANDWTSVIEQVGLALAQKFSSL